DVAHRLLLDGREPARDVALCRLGPEKVRAGLLDHVDVVVVEGLETGADVVVHAAFGDEVLATGQLARLAEDHRAAGLDPAVDEVGRDAAGTEAGRGVGLAVLHGQHDVGAVHRLSGEFAGLLEELLGVAGRALDDPQVTLALDGHAVDRLSGLGDAVGDDVGP